MMYSGRHSISARWPYCQWYVDALSGQREIVSSSARFSISLKNMASAYRKSWSSYERSQPDRLLNDAWSKMPRTKNVCSRRRVDWNITNGLSGSLSLWVLDYPMDCPLGRRWSKRPTAFPYAIAIRPIRVTAYVAWPCSHIAVKECFSVCVSKECSPFVLLSPLRSFLDVSRNWPLSRTS